MGRRYVLLMEDISVSTLKSLIEFTAPTDAIVILHEAWISQENSETSTQEVAEILRKTAAGTGSAFTARKLESSDSAFGGSVRTDMTAEGTLGDVLVQEGFNILNGWYYRPTPEAKIIVEPGGILALRFSDAPEAAIDVSAGMIIEEVG